MDNAKFCKSCGKNLEEYINPGNGETPNVQYTPPVTEKSYTLAFVLGLIFSILIPLIGIIIGIYVYTRKDSSNAQLYGGIIIGLGVIVWIVSLMLSFSMGLY